MTYMTYEDAMHLRSTIESIIGPRYTVTIGTARSAYDKTDNFFLGIMEGHHCLLTIDNEENWKQVAQFCQTVADCLHTF